MQHILNEATTGEVLAVRLSSMDFCIISALPPRDYPFGVETCASIRNGLGRAFPLWTSTQHKSETSMDASLSAQSRV